jgi:aminoglycoside phosphotransferase (APT) family kinase protein
MSGASIRPAHGAQNRPAHGAQSRPARGAPFAYATTHAITEVRGEDGSTLLRKDLSPTALLPPARGVTPDFLVDPEREVAVYEHLLPAAGVPTATCHAALSDAATGEHWLLLERVDGPVLWQVGEPDVWDDVMRVTAVAHRRLAPFAAKPPAPLLHHDAAYYARWTERGEAATAHAAPARRSRLLAVLTVHAELAPALVALPRGIVHGELFPSNVVVGTGDGGRRRICLIDWEMAAVGAPALDVAALTTGWAEPRRTELIGTYAERAGLDPAATAAQVALCELHLCVRMLAWSPGWRPPAEHERDWLARAEELAAEVAR